MKSKLQELRRPTASSSPHKNDVVEVSSTVSDISDTDGRQVSSRDVTVASEKRQSQGEAKSTTAAPGPEERSSTTLASGIERSRLSAVKVGGSSTSFYYPGVVKDDQRLSQSKRLSMVRIANVLVSGE